MHGDYKCSQSATVYRLIEVVQQLSAFLGMAIDRIKAEGGHRSGVEVAPALFINGIRCTNCRNVKQLITVIVATSN
jgi:hypothetical protein